MELFSLTFQSTLVAPKVKGRISCQIVGTTGETLPEILSFDPSLGPLPGLSSCFTVVALTPIGQVESLKILTTNCSWGVSDILVHGSSGNHWSTGPQQLESNTIIVLKQGPPVLRTWLLFRNASYSEWQGTLVVAQAEQPPPVQFQFPSQQEPLVVGNPRAVVKGGQALWAFDFSVGRPREVSEHCFYKLLGREQSFAVPACGQPVSFGFANGNSGSSINRKEEWKMWGQLGQEIQNKAKPCHLLLLSGFLDSGRLWGLLRDSRDQVLEQLFNELWLLHLSTPAIASVVSRVPCLFVPESSDVGRSLPLEEIDWGQGLFSRFADAGRKAFLFFTRLDTEANLEPEVTLDLGDDDESGFHSEILFDVNDVSAPNSFIYNQSPDRLSPASETESSPAPSRPPRISISDMPELSGGSGSADALEELADTSFHFRGRNEDDQASNQSAPLLALSVAGLGSSRFTTLARNQALHQLHRVDESAFILLDVTQVSGHTLLSEASVAWLRAAIERLEPLQFLFFITPLPLVFPEHNLIQFAESWASYSADQRDEMIRLLAAAGAKTGAEVVVLSGHVRVGAAGYIESTRRIYQFTSSAIRAPPPPKTALLALSSSFATVRQLASASLISHPVPGKSGLFIAQRNFLLVSHTEAGLTARWLCESARGVVDYVACLQPPAPAAAAPPPIEPDTVRRVLARTLRSPHRLTAFLHFLDTKGLANLLRFWQEVESFKLVCLQPDLDSGSPSEKASQPDAQLSGRNRLAVALYRIYLSPRALLPIGLSKELKSQLRDLILSRHTDRLRVDETTFDAAQSEALQLLQEVFVEFLASPFAPLPEGTSDKQLRDMHLQLKRQGKDIAARDAYKKQLFESIEQALELGRRQPAQNGLALCYCARWWTRLCLDFKIPFHQEAFKHFKQAEELRPNSLPHLYAYWADAYSSVLELASEIPLTPAEVSQFQKRALRLFSKSLALRQTSRALMLRADHWLRIVRLHLYNPRAQDPLALLLGAHSDYADSLALKPTGRRALTSWSHAIEACLANYRGDRRSAGEVALAIEAYLNALVIYALRTKENPRPDRPLLPDLTVVRAMCLGEHKWVADKAHEALTHLSERGLSAVVDADLRQIDETRQQHRLRSTEDEKRVFLKSLPADLQRELRLAGIPEPMLMQHWEAFLDCLRFYAGPKVAQLIPFPIEPLPRPPRTPVDLAGELRRLLRPQDPGLDYTDWFSLGKGGFGEVFKAKSRLDGSAVALKVLGKSTTDRQIFQEIRFLQTSDHECIVRFYAAYQHKSRVTIAMEYCDAGDLLTLLRSVQLEELEVAYIVWRVALALDYLHSQNRVHRDVKAANVLLNHDGSVKLADMGNGIELQIGEQASHSAGTQRWMAPEVFTRRRYDSKADVWSLGCLLHELCEGEPPHASSHPLHALLWTVVCEPQPFSVGWSDTLLFYDPEMLLLLLSSVAILMMSPLMPKREFGRQCLQRDPTQRATVAQLLLSPFLSELPYQRNLVLPHFTKKLSAVFVFQVLQQSGLAGF